MPAGKVVTVEQLLPMLVRWKQAGNSVVWTNGCFDLLHVGHVRSLREARSLGDVLIVGVNSDRSVRVLKGPTRPLVPEADRAEVLAALECIDAVVLFDESTPEAMIALLQPTICCKGNDYAPGGKSCPEAVLVEGYGGRMAYLSFSPGISTTELARRASQQSTEPVRSPRPAVFLDRDGTLVEDVGYPSDPGQLHLLPGVVAALKELRAKDYSLVIISNQSGVGRGYFSRQDADRVHQRMIDLLREQGIELDESYYCYHAPSEKCRCRKPAPGLLLSAADELGLDLAKSFMIGDKASDVRAGRAAGARTVLYIGSTGRIDDEEGLELEHVAADWPAVTAYLLAQTPEKP